MSLLHEIQAEAIDGGSDLETVLRRCRLLAARLKLAEFKEWVESELNGYQRASEVPKYRKFHCNCYGHFEGPFGRSGQNVPIPESLIPQDVREPLTRMSLCQGVAALKEMVASAGNAGIRIQWPADAARLFGQNIYPGAGLVQGFMLLSSDQVVGILSTIRNRILNFVLEIEESNPDAGEASASSPRISKEALTQIFNTTIYGSVGNVASGRDIHQNATVHVVQENFESLATFLKDQGLAAQDIRSLKAAIDTDPPPSKSDGSFGKSVSAWIGSMIAKAAQGTWKIAVTVATSLLTDCLKKYYGLSGPH